MAHAGGYEHKLNSLKKALNSLEEPLDLDLDSFEPVARDTIKNGQVQKFEVCVELFWKTLRKFLREIHGIETASPKMAIKGFFDIGYIDADEYENIIEMINDRNLMSHVYNEGEFDEISGRLPGYFGGMKLAVEKLG